MIAKIISEKLILRLYVLGLGMLFAGLPLSKGLVSISFIVLGVAWLAEGDFIYKWNQLKRDKALWAFLLFFALFIMGLLGSDDLPRGVSYVSRLAPLCFIPLIFATTRASLQRYTDMFLLIFSGAVVISSVVSTALLFEIVGEGYSDIREISPFISHIRLSLMVVMAIAIVFYYAFRQRQMVKKILPLLVAHWLMLFLFWLQALTGIAVFFLLLLLTPLWLAWQNQSVKMRLALLMLPLIPLLMTLVFVAPLVQQYHEREELDFSRLEAYTEKGTPYFHDTTSHYAENGHYVWIYIADKELEEAWNARSEMDFRGLDAKGQELRPTLIRYLASRGLRKDATGVHGLTDEDIQHVEKGHTNYIFVEKKGLYPKLYEFLWQLESMREGEGFEGHSVTLRLVYLRAGWAIARENIWMGVGVGNLQEHFDRKYHEMDIRLTENKKRRAHNQYLTFVILFGIFGGVVAVAALFTPFFIVRGYRDFLFVTFFWIMTLSMLHEDTLETHIGASFVAAFYTFFTFLWNRQNQTPG